MGVFVYLPHVFFVEEFGGEHFEASMRAPYPGAPRVELVVNGQAREAGAFEVVD